MQTTLKQRALSVAPSLQARDWRAVSDWNRDFTQPRREPCRSSGL